MEFLVNFLYFKFNTRYLGFQFLRLNLLFLI